MADKLCTVPLFAELERDHVHAIARLVEQFEVDAGYVLIHAGAVGSGMFLIEEGSVTVSIPDREIELGPGEIVGELSLLDERAKHVSRVRTKTPVKGYAISRDAFNQLLHDEPRIALPMLRVLASRLVNVLTHH